MEPPADLVKLDRSDPLDLLVQPENVVSLEVLDLQAKPDAQASRDCPDLADQLVQRVGEVKLAYQELQARGAPAVQRVPPASEVSQDNQVYPAAPEPQAISDLVVRQDPAESQEHQEAVDLMDDPDLRVSLD